MEQQREPRGASVGRPWKSIAALLLLALLGTAFAAANASATVGGLNGKIVFSSNRAASDGTTDFEIYVMSADGSGVVQLTDTQPVLGEDGVTLTDIQDLEPAVSPDGTQIAFTSNRSLTDESADNEIYLMNMDGSGLTQVTDQFSGPPSGNAEFEPAWSPDGKKIAFRRGNGVAAELYIIDLETKNETLLPGTGEGVKGFDGLPAWSPDGKTIAFRRGSGSGADIWLWDLARSSGSALTAVGDVTETQPNWSPDGKTIVFARGDEGVGAGIWVISSSGGVATPLTSPTTYSDTAPAWSPDGTRIVFQTSRHGTPPASEGESARTIAAPPDPDDQTDVGNLELYSMSAQGLDPVRLTSDGDPTGPKDQMADWQTVPSSDLSVVLTDSPDPLVSGEQLLYTLTVTNGGPTPASGVEATIALPQGVTIVSVVAASGTCTSASTVLCSISSIPTGEQAKVGLLVTASDAGTLAASALATGDQPDPDVANNTAAASTTVVAGPPGRCTITGTPGDDLIPGTPGNDYICALGGDDVIYARRGADVVVAGDGDDTVFGGRGNDTVLAGSGKDVVFAGKGRDVVSGQKGADRLIGDAGPDTLKGGNGKDVLSGAAGDDRLFGNAAGDRMTGGAGRDRLSGGDGNDRMFGKGNGDTLNGGKGRDVLSGGAGNDRIQAKDGRVDRVDGGKGTDTARIDAALDAVRRVERIL